MSKTPYYACNEIFCQNQDDFLILRSYLLNKDGEVDFNNIIEMPDELTAIPDYGSHFTAIAYFLGNGEEMDTDKVASAISERYPDVVIGEEAIEEGQHAIDPNVVVSISSISADSELIQSEKESVEAGIVEGFYNFKDFADYGEKALECYIKHRCFNSAEWKILYWGDKTNAIDTKIDYDKMSILFWTNVPVIKLVQQLSFKLQMPIYMQYTGRYLTFAGEDVFANGIPVEESNYKYEISLEDLNNNRQSKNTRELYKIACRMHDPSQETYRLSSSNVIVTEDGEITGSFVDCAERFKSLTPIVVASKMLADFRSRNWCSVRDLSHQKELCAAGV